jgi:hypothetical protein
MALKVAYGEEDSLDLWGETHIDDQARADAPSQWVSFAAQASPGQVTIGTVIKAAKDAGFVLAVLPSPAATGFVTYGPFTMGATEGLMGHRKGKNGVIVSDWISAPFEILGACRDPNGRAWGKQLRFRDADNRLHMHHVQDAALHGDPGVICATSASEGLSISRSMHGEFRRISEWRKRRRAAHDGLAHRLP